VNDNLLSVNVDLSVANPNVDDLSATPSAHRNDVRIAGW
jgi:hypothetical protein